MKVDIEMLKALAEHAQSVGTIDKWVPIALTYAEQASAKVIRLTKLLEETSGWLGPHEHNPKELFDRVQKELNED